MASSRKAATGLSSNLTRERDVLLLFSPSLHQRNGYSIWTVITGSVIPTSSPGLRPLADSKYPRARLLQQRPLWADRDEGARASRSSHHQIRFHREINTRAAGEGAARRTKVPRAPRHPGLSHWFRSGPMNRVDETNHTNTNNSRREIAEASTESFRPADNNRGMVHRAHPL